MSDMIPEYWWAMAAGALCCVACAILGCFLVLRQMSLLGDAISHAVLPGIVGAFMLTGSRGSLPIVIGAMVVGVLTAWLTSILHRWGRVPEDASMGVVFTSLFAIGVLMVNTLRHVDLDADCVLYGLLEFTASSTLNIAGAEIPRAVVILGGVLIADAVLIVLFYKELKIVSFDPQLASAMGINTTLVHYGLMAAVAGTTVAAFESVGSILVIAMLIAPAAAAYMLCDRLSHMLIIAASIGLLSAALGVERAVAWDTSMAGAISVVAGVVFALAVMLAPRHGFLIRQIQRLGLTLRIVREDVLGMLYRWEESGRGPGLERRHVLAALQGGAMPRLALWSLRRREQVSSDAARRVQLTPTGLAAARTLVRSHRLWESYLARQLGLPLDHLHEPAMRMEHFVTDQMRDRLEQHVGAQSDPHGRDIPSA